MSIRKEVIQLRLEVITILDRLDELSLSFDDPDEKLAAQRIVNKMNNVVCDMVFLEQ